ncbi:hypothetical protein CRG98_043629 [Punica granatum]|uniref:Uncharacterized protein n=1 Tax=Punica granatum TaxID=22663 RepID=A0A2I0HW96_PUNGR|nr:hypothetical protein CRG98_043629 [Punica granatum]
MRLHLRLLKHMHALCTMFHPTSHNRRIIRPRRSSFSRHHHNNKPQSRAEPWLQDRLSRRNGLLLRKLNRAMLPHIASANNLFICLLLCPTFIEKIQEIIDAKQIFFNEVKPPNVRANPLPDHGSSSGPTSNMISIYAIGEEEEAHKSPTPFVIEYVPAEVAVASASFIIEVPAKEPYQDSRVP